MDTGVCESWGSYGEDIAEAFRVIVVHNIVYLTAVSDGIYSERSLYIQLFKGLVLRDQTKVQREAPLGRDTGI